MSSCDAAKVNGSSVGCEFYAHNPTFINDTKCHALFVANVSKSAVTLSGEVAGVAIDLSKYAYLPQGSGPSLTLSPLGQGAGLAPGTVAIVFLRGACGGKQSAAAGETAAALVWNDRAQQTDLGAAALRFITSEPVLLYDISPYGGGASEITDASLLLPISTWGTNYIAITPRPVSYNTLSPAIAIVASEQGTTVSLRSKVAILPLGGVTGGPANTPQTYALDRGQVLRIEQQEDVLGSVITSNKPIGLWGEQDCINIDQNACDAAHEQIPAVSALGHEYVSVRYRDRLPGTVESPPVRITGVVDGTQLIWDPSPPPGAQSTVGRGESFEMRSNLPFSVKSQDSRHPFYVAAYMTGGQAYENRGDPEFVSVIPPAQWLRDYPFFTDPTYPETHLVFTRMRGANGFAEVTLDCMGTLSGWAPVGTAGLFEYVRTDLSTGNFVGQHGCDNGFNHASSAEPFGLTIWGWGSAATGASGSSGYSQFVSYAYPAGASVQKINSVVVPLK